MRSRRLSCVGFCCDRARRFDDRAQGFMATRFHRLLACAARLHTMQAARKAQAVSCQLRRLSSICRTCQLEFATVSRAQALAALCIRNKKTSALARSSLVLTHRCVHLSGIARARLQIPAAALHRATFLCRPLTRHNQPPNRTACVAHTSKCDA